MWHLFKSLRWCGGCWWWLGDGGVLIQLTCNPWFKVGLVCPKNSTFVKILHQSDPTTDTMSSDNDLSLVFDTPPKLLIRVYGDFSYHNIAPLNNHNEAGVD